MIAIMRWYYVAKRRQQENSSTYKLPKQWVKIRYWRKLFQVVTDSEIDPFDFVEKAFKTYSSAPWPHSLYTDEYFNTYCRKHRPSWRNQCELHVRELRQYKNRLLELEECGQYVPGSGIVPEAVKESPGIFAWCVSLREGSSEDASEFKTTALFHAGDPALLAAYWDGFPEEIAELVSPGLPRSPYAEDADRNP
jgi:hypothetical protein